MGQVDEDENDIFGEDDKDVYKAYIIYVNFIRQNVDKGFWYDGQTKEALVYIKKG